MICPQSIAPMNRVKLREPTQISKWQSEDSIQFHLAAKPIYIFSFSCFTTLHHDNYKTLGLN